jgi:hypothetical protein
MKTPILCSLVLLASLAWATDSVEVKVVAVHQVTHESRDTRAILEKGIMGAGRPGRHTESYNLDVIINDEHVVLACDDDKGCESPKLGTYRGEVKRRGHVRVKFSLPLSDKTVDRWYKVAGSW